MRIRILPTADSEIRNETVLNLEAQAGSQESATFPLYTRCASPLRPQHTLSGSKRFWYRTIGYQEDSMPTCLADVVYHVRDLRRPSYPPEPRLEASRMLGRVLAGSGLRLYLNL